MPEQVIIEAASDGGATSGGLTLTASTDHTVAAENHSRDKLIVTADTADIWVSLGTSAAVVGQGIRVKAGGPPYEVTGWKGEVHCISSGAAVLGVEETSFSVGADEGEQPTGADTFVPSGPSDSYFTDAIESAENDPAPPGTSYPPQN